MRRVRLRRWMAAAVMMTANGCAMFHDAYRVDPAVATKRPCGLARFAKSVSRGELSDQTIYLNEYEFPDESVLKDGPENRLAYERATQSKDDRDRLTEQVVALSNDMCFKHMGDYISQQSLNELLIGGAVLGLTAGGSVAASAATKLAAAATGLGGLRTLVDDTVYYKQLTPAIMKRALAERNKVLFQIAAKLQVNSLQPEDIAHYQAACSLECGVTVWEERLDACFKAKKCAEKTKDDEIKKCHDGCGADIKKLEVKSGAQLETACRERCATTRVFPCPNMLQGDIVAAQKAASESDDEVSKAKTALKDTIDGVAKLDKLSTAAKSNIVESAVRYKMKAEEDKKKEGDKNKPPLCRLWTDYAVDDVLADLTQYHDSCSFYRALGVAAEDIQKSADAINKDLQGIYKTTAKDSASGNKPATSGSEIPTGQPSPQPSPTN